MDESQAPILRVARVEKAYGDREVLREVSFELYPGELFGLLGPNGAGKTTLIRCLSGQLKLDRGDFHWHPSRADVRLGVVPQSLAIYSDLTAEQNLRAFGKLHGVRGRLLKSRVDQALEWSNLGDRRKHLAKTFSGGMKRRLNIACSVLHEPQLILLDEPTVGVDPQSRERIYDMLEQLRSQGVAVLLTTHHLEEAQFRCDRIAIIDGGRIVKAGTLDELITATVGHRQHLTLGFAEPVDGDFDLSWTENRQTAESWLEDTSRELPLLLQSLQEAGHPVSRIAVESPNLHQVFLELTGKALRE